MLSQGAIVFSDKRLKPDISLDLIAAPRDLDILWGRHLNVSLVGAHKMVAVV
jgi:hypothetical protein